MKKSQAAPDVAGGSGWIISGENLLPKITNLTLFREEFSNDPLREAIEALWTEHPDQALLLLAKLPKSRRQRALTADCLRDLGQFLEAETIYSELISASTGPLLEATYRQHLGKVHLCADNYRLALHQFERALEIRIAAHAPEELLASSRQACAFVISARSTFISTLFPHCSN
ncbi:tetratricopeptide repeat protein [uncultured Rothia sp.]|uniref:tetratricopeptide repeat protein n=1 Tax=uncultured Rothia sp. TaxID=316088 RepID=UPI003216BB62